MEKNSESIFLKTLKLLFRYKKTFLSINILVFLISLMISILLPKWYKGSVTIIVNDESSNTLLANMVGNIPIDILGGSSTKIEQYINFVKSRNILDQLDSLYGLFEYYEVEYRKRFYDKLKDDLIIIDNEDNTFTLNFFYKEDPVKAANVANSIYQLLFDLSLKLKKDKNTRLVVFLEKSYFSTLKKLEKAQTELTKFQVENEIFEIESQLKLLIEKITELEVEKIKIEIELKYLQENLDQNNQQIKALQTRLKVLNGKIDQMRYGSDKNNIALISMPKLAFEYFNLYRDVEVLNKVLEFLIPQYENAKIQDIKTDTDIQLLDRAVPEDYKSKPKRIAIVFTATFLSIILSILLIFLIDFYKNNRSFFRDLLNTK